MPVFLDRFPQMGFLKDSDKTKSLARGLSCLQQQPLPLSFPLFFLLRRLCPVPSWITTKMPLDHTSRHHIRLTTLLPTAPSHLGICSLHNAVVFCLSSRAFSFQRYKLREWWAQSTRVSGTRRDQMHFCILSGVSTPLTDFSPHPRHVLYKLPLLLAHWLLSSPTPSHFYTTSLLVFITKLLRHGKDESLQ